ncbi:hypothetical protein HOU41_gp023 [Proteus phage Stubb]|uniref:Uncharacterized protein n=1 Tax=Proteus phage Stubb TaxID=2315597 RepID=A0A3B8DIY8_9CAUD|nr:hypothetical protein HOU41_gp023 [Proteus phage Stubb]AYJ73163.1 hypothetical protein CPT_Stubb_023 [Proteus phage Stubb]
MKRVILFPRAYPEPFIAVYEDKDSKKIYFKDIGSLSVEIDEDGIFLILNGQQETEAVLADRYGTIRGIDFILTPEGEELYHELQETLEKLNSVVGVYNYD